MVDQLSADSLVEPPDDPFLLFAEWYELARHCSEIKYAHAVCLSTVDGDGFPDGRTVLMKDFDASGFVFFTDRGSPKARALERQPRAALTFYWGPLDLQIRIGGQVELASDAVSDECFQQRPRGSQLTAWASQQSQPLVTRRDLEERLEHFARRFADRDPLPRPAHWQAYRLEPGRLEFWRARAHRLHDRLLYTRAVQGRWEWAWLSP